MGNDFNIDEVLEMAEQIERNGAAFYRKAAENVADESGKDLLVQLAVMEDQHERIFAILRTELTDGEKAPATFDPDGDTPKYLKALADMRVFYKKEIDLTSLEDILLNAITAEKDSIAFYVGMKDLIPERHGKNKVDAILKEEASHITILTDKLTDLKNA